mmetsp:Transcript_27934/g.90275  ORF Transcript_27934/g.90275 Transcript_27934/m.90275 type:complete len:232 (+) Transcript_27934:84-779(+)
MIGRPQRTLWRVPRAPARRAPTERRDCGRCVPRGWGRAGRESGASWSGWSNWGWSDRREWLRRWRRPGRRSESSVRSSRPGKRQRSKCYRRRQAFSRPSPAPAPPLDPSLPGTRPCGQSWLGCAPLSDRLSRHESRRRRGGARQRRRGARRRFGRPPGVRRWRRGARSLIRRERSWLDSNRCSRERGMRRRECPRRRRRRGIALGENWRRHGLSSRLCNAGCRRRRRAATP